MKQRLTSLVTCLVFSVFFCISCAHQRDISSDAFNAPTQSSDDSNHVFSEGTPAQNVAQQDEQAAGPSDATPLDVTKAQPVIAQNDTDALALPPAGQTAPVVQDSNNDPDASTAAPQPQKDAAPKPDLENAAPAVNSPQEDSGPAASKDATAIVVQASPAVPDVAPKNIDDSVWSVPQVAKAEKPIAKAKRHRAKMKPRLETKVAVVAAPEHVAMAVKQEAVQAPRVMQQVAPKKVEPVVAMNDKAPMAEKPVAPAPNVLSNAVPNTQAVAMNAVKRPEMAKPPQARFASVELTTFIGNHLLMLCVLATLFFTGLFVALRNARRDDEMKV